MKIDESFHSAGIPTKPLQGMDFIYKRARILGLEGGVPPPPKAQPEDAAGLETASQEPAGLAWRPSVPARRRTAAPPGAVMAARYEHLALGPAPGHRAPRRTYGPGPGMWGRALVRAGLAA